MSRMRARIRPDVSRRDAHGAKSRWRSNLVPESFGSRRRSVEMIRQAALARRPGMGASGAIGSPRPLLFRSMTDGGPIHRGGPDGLSLVIMDNAVRAEFVGISLIIRVIHIEREDQPFVQFDALALQVFPGSGTCQSQPVGVVKIL